MNSTVRIGMLALTASFVLGACRVVESSSANSSEQKILWAIPAGERIGFELDEFNRPKPAKFSAPASCPAELERGFRRVLLQELQTRNAELAGTRFTPKIIFLRFQLYGQKENQRAEAWLTVDWDIEQNGESIHQSTSTGQSSGCESVETAELKAFQDATRKFFGQSRVADLVRGRPEATEASYAQTDSTQIRLPRASQVPASSVSEMIRRSKDSVFTIQGATGHGTAFFVHPDGYAITAKHVVQGLTECEAQLADGRKLVFTVRRLGRDSDVALLQAPNGKYPALPIGKLETSELGEEIYSIGTPVYLNFAQSVSKGIVSAIRRENSFPSLQTDLAMNPGCSGAPVLNLRGEVIGIVNRKLVAEDVEGVGFCISAERAVAALQLMNP